VCLEKKKKSLDTGVLCKTDGKSEYQGYSTHGKRRKLS
jgi:hypothetical protein